MADATCAPGEPADCRNATEPRPKLGPTPGLLFRADGVETGRISPSDALLRWIEHYWWVRWDVPEARANEVLTYPSVHVVFEGDEARVTGVVRARFSRTLEGQGAVFGVKFQPGMFRAFSPAAVSKLTDRVVPLSRELGPPALELARTLVALPDELERAKLLETALTAVVPTPDPDAELARDLVTRVRTDGSLLSVAELSRASGLSVRALQRLFHEYVGVPPKWVVRRFRLQEASERLKSGNETVAAVAASLGYFDQAHFVRDFKAEIGKTPIEYRRIVNS